MNGIQIFIIVLAVVNWIMLRACYLKLFDDPDNSPVRMWISILRTRNAFGIICSVIVIIVTLPAIIAFYLVVLLLMIIYGIQYLGIKKNYGNRKD